MIMSDKIEKKADEVKVMDNATPAPEENSAVEYLTFLPPVDIFESNGIMKLLLDMPGTGASGVSVHIEDQVLKISGDTEMIDYGRSVRYKREFPISNELDTTGITAKIKDGVLEVILPKLDSAKVHKVQVSAG